MQYIIFYLTPLIGVDKRTKRPSQELQCFHGDCQSAIDRKYLAVALDAKTLAKYDEVQAKVIVQAAGLSENLCSCPKCGFQAELPDGQNIFSCPECVRGSCVPSVALVGAVPLLSSTLTDRFLIHRDSSLAESVVGLLTFHSDARKSRKKRKRPKV